MPIPLYIISAHTHTHTHTHTLQTHTHTHCRHIHTHTLQTHTHTHCRHIHTHTLQTHTHTHTLITHLQLHSPQIKPPPHTAQCLQSEPGAISEAHTPAPVVRGEERTLEECKGGGRGCGPLPQSLQLTPPMSHQVSVC